MNEVVLVPVLTALYVYPNNYILRTNMQDTLISLAMEFINPGSMNCHQFGHKVRILKNQFAT